MKLVTTISLASIAAFVAGCATAPPPELRDARAEHDRAANGLAAQLAPADLHVATEQLAVAEQSFRDRGDTFETRDLAYAAQRKARLAEVRAATIAAGQSRADAQAELAKLKDDAVRVTSAKLSSAQQALAVQGVQLAQAERDKEAAEKRSREASADLARIASVHQEPRGMVITLSGSVLFASGQSELLPQAQAKLSEIANVLTRQDPDSKIEVQGYTDSQGSDTFNVELSRKRAEAVRTYLVGHGIAADRVTAEGLGSARPLTSNTSAEGRANNRRVEIVIEPRTPTHR